MQLNVSPVRSLSSLLEGIVPLPLEFERQLHGLSLDSRRVNRGDLFFACKGLTRDGRDFIDEAIGRGAAAVLAEADEQLSGDATRCQVPVIAVPELPRQMARVAARFFALPATRLHLVGITGTNGKTSCCRMAAQLLTALGRRCGVIGTLGYGLSDGPLRQDAGVPGTTPDAVSLQRQLAELLAAGADTVVMEVSSHGLAQHRVLVDDYATAMFTNLTRDHLDLHGTMEAYGASKRHLFEGERLGLAVLNADDGYVRATAALLPAGVRVLTWSLRDASADIYATDLQFTRDGMRLRVATPWGEYPLQTILLGSFNASNLLGVLALVLGELAATPGFNAQAVFAAAATLQPVPGRMQLIRSAAPLAVVVDYAHTPDGLQKALEAMREHTSGKLWCVFGCGGDRDRGKRALMGAVAESGADHLVLTNDNPRSEDPHRILADVLSGLRFPKRALVEPDRAKAIGEAVCRAAPGDALLIAGKGHEDYQEIQGKRVHFNDAEQASAALGRWQAPPRGGRS